MIVNLAQFSNQTQTIIRQFLNMHPVPQVPSWIACAEQLKAKGRHLEAAVIMDLIAVKYGRDTARRQWKQCMGVNIGDCGKGSGFASNAVAMGYGPILLMGSLFVGVGDRISVCHILEGWKPSIDLDEVRKTGLRLANVRLSSAAYTLVVAVDDTLYTIEDNVLKPVMTFERKIMGLSEGLDSGEILVLVAAVSPVFAPDCILVRGIGKTPEAVPLPNVQQKLFGDCVAYDEGWVTCNGGMQNSEVRFIHPDGSWETRFAHEKRVLRVACSERGPVSIDADGQAFLWDGETVIEDRHFAVDLLPQEVLEHISEYQAGVDWGRGILYLNDKAEQIEHVDAWQLSDVEIAHNAFVYQIYPSRSGLCAALLGDGYFHFWNLEQNCVVASWQMPELLGEAEDWRTLLDNKIRLSIEDDPRIRKIVVDDI